jgi:hypothetical protein
MNQVSQRYVGVYSDVAILMDGVTVYLSRHGRLFTFHKSEFHQLVPDGIDALRMSEHSYVSYLFQGYDSIEEAFSSLNAGAIPRFGDGDTGL